MGFMITVSQCEALVVFAEDEEDGRCCLMMLNSLSSLNLDEKAGRDIFLLGSRGTAVYMLTPALQFRTPLYPV